MRAAYHYSRKGSIVDALHQLPSFHVQTMFVPGCTAGLLWSLGNMASIVSVTILGQSIGYSVVQSAMLVSGIWGIFYYHEVKGTRNIQLWFAFAIITIVGIIWLGHEHIPNSGS